MSIQFRCIHCHQLLGISNSRVGTHVDCPACGRSLRVPLESGGQAAPVRTVGTQPDAGLLVALEELATLTELGDNSRRADRKAGAARSESPAPPLARKEEHLRIVPIKSQPHQNLQATGEPTLFESPERMFEQLANLPPSGQNEEPLILTDPDSTAQKAPVMDVIAPISKRVPARRSFADFGDEHIDALAELAASVTTPGSASTVDSNREQMSTSDSDKRGKVTVAKFAGLLGISAASFIGGFATGIYRNPANSEISAVRQMEPNEQTVLKQMIDSAPSSVSEHPPIELITGRVTFLDESGTENPDSNALILLLPARKDTNLKLDARPLRDLTRTPGRSAVEAALETLGASMIRTDETGQFKMPRRTSGPASLIIVSRHAVRNVADAANDEVLTDISKWFENPSQVIGRLAAQHRPLSEVASETIVPPLVINFALQK